MMANERKTENLVRNALKERGYFDSPSEIVVEEQKSGIETVKRALRNASKSEGGGGGSPEFIISSPNNPDFLLIVECKAKNADHSSKLVTKILAGDKIQETDEERAKRKKRFAVDGALHYAAALSREYNVIVLAVSGESKSAMEVATFLWPKGGSCPKTLQSNKGAELNKVIPWADYIEHATYDPSIQKLRFDELMNFSSDLHEFMRDHAKLTENEKPLLVSGTLIALRSEAFSKSFDVLKPDKLQSEWLRVIRDEIQAAEIPKAKKESMTQPYSSIAVHPELGKAIKAYPKGVLHELIARLSKKVWPFISVYHDFDVVGQFYGEFLKYAGGDKKSLGIVLTPRHITELFALLANVNKNSKVLDICAGTGGFLVSAMHQMFKLATTEKERERIRKYGLIGVEQQPNMFALAASNMILRGDGKANLYQGSCFDTAIVEEVKKHQCGIGMINPPYSQADTEQHELKFVKQMLDCLKEGGTGIAIVPMSCALAANGMRAEIMRAHTLEAVMSMPQELFYPVGTVTCIMVWTTGIPHSISNRKTWFGYWRDDGYVKIKHKGRIDLYGRWPKIRDHWVEMFRNREVHAGESVMQKVTADDEWCAEAYMETDYSKLTIANFENVVRNYAIYRLVGGKDAESGVEDNDPVE